MKIFYFLLSFLPLIISNTECPIVTSIADRRKDNSTFRLVQYNAEWLFIDYYSSAKCPGTGCSWHTIDEAETHLTNVANVLKELNADMVNICEVEGCDELNMLIEELKDTTYIYMGRRSKKDTAIIGEKRRGEKRRGEKRRGVKIKKV